MSEDFKLNTNFANNDTFWYDYIISVTLNHEH